MQKYLSCFKWNCAFLCLLGALKIDWIARDFLYIYIEYLLKQFFLKKHSTNNIKYIKFLQYILLSTKFTAFFNWQILGLKLKEYFSE